MPRSKIYSVLKYFDLIGLDGYFIVTYESGLRRYYGDGLSTPKTVRNFIIKNRSCAVINRNTVLECLYMKICPAESAPESSTSAPAPESSTSAPGFGFFPYRARDQS